MPDSPANVLYCTKCHHELPAYVFRSEKPRPCPSCGAIIQEVLFPAFFEGTKSRPGQALLIDTDASCFYHLQKKAEITCDYCGRFLCALCEVEIDGKKLCPPCIEAGRVKGRIKSLENRRVLYDSIALSLSTVPLLIFYLTFVTAPIALYMAVRYWNKPTSILHRNKWRFVLAIIFSSAQIMTWGVVAYYFITRVL